MNSFERIMATIQGTPRDRTPFIPVLSMYGAKLTSCDLKQYYQNSSLYLEGQKKVYEIFQPDAIFSPFCLALEGKVFGSEIKFYDNQAPNLRKPGIRNISDLMTLSVETLLEHPSNQYIFSSIRKLSEYFQGKVPILGITLSPVDLPIMLFGLEEWLRIILFEKEIMHQILNFTTTYFLRKTEKIFQAGATFLIFPLCFCNPQIITTDIAKNFAEKILPPVFEQLAGPVIFHSGGANLEPFLESFQKLPNIGGFCISKEDSLSLSRKKIPSEKVLIGNIDGPNLHHFLPGELYKHSLKLLSEMENDSRFILGTSGADIPFQTNPDTILEMKQAVMDFKKTHSNQHSPGVTCVACSIFKNEISQLQKEKKFNLPVKYLNSMLHMDPEKLENSLQTLLNTDELQNQKILVAYGDCCSHMIDIGNRENTTRVRGINCIDIFLGKEKYRALRKKGAFFFMKEWANRWKEVFEIELGLDEKTAKIVLGDMHKEILFIDTGSSPLDSQILEEISEFTGLPCSILKVDLSEFQKNLESALDKFREEAT